MIRLRVGTAGKCPNIWRMEMDWAFHLICTILFVKKIYIIKGSVQYVDIN